MAAFLAVALSAPGADAADDAKSPEITIASKVFTESVILGEIIKHLARTAGGTPRHRRQQGGTRVLWGALIGAEIDVYPEYTGTIAEELFAGKGLDTDRKIRTALARQGILMGRPLGFNNTYAIGMKPAVAQRLGIRNISDLVRHPSLRLGFGNEFMDRADGWPGLRKSYGLPQKNVRGLDHDLAYRGLDGDSIDAMDVYTTDAEISYYGLKLIEDDRQHFPIYNAVILYRAELAARAPRVTAAIAKLAGRIDAAAMARMNARVKLQKISESQVASDFLARNLNLTTRVDEETFVERFVRHTLEHLTLVGISLSAAIILSIPLGILATRRRTIGQIILGVVGIIQTIPSLALFVFMIPLLGIGGPPAIVTLFLFSLLPIVRNTYAGLNDIAPSIRESAEALGLPPLARLRIVELPIAARTILAGIKTSAVINVGTATLGALIGAGGYGQPILTGIRLDDIGLILEGAVPAALLALMLQGIFEIAERLVVAKGLRLKPAP